MSASEHAMVAASDVLEGVATNEVQALLALFFCGVIGWSISFWARSRLSCFESLCVDDKLKSADTETDSDKEQHSGAVVPESAIREKILAEQGNGRESHQFRDRQIQRQHMRKRVGVVDESDCLSALSAHVDVLLDDALKAEADKEAFAAFS